MSLFFISGGRILSGQTSYFGLLFQERYKNTTETQKKICALYGEGAVTDGMCQKWFVKFLGTIDILTK